MKSPLPTRYFLIAVLCHVALFAALASLKIVAAPAKLRAFFEATPLPISPADPYAPYRDFEYRSGPKSLTPVVPAGYQAHIDAPAAPDKPELASVIGVLNDGSGGLIVRPARTTAVAGPSFAARGFGNGRTGSGTNGLAQPDYLQNPSPAYPLLARRNGWEGTAVLRVDVTTTGTAAQVALLQSSGHSVLDEAATAAVRRWRFRPARLGNDPVDSEVDVPVRFLLSQ